jgi:hypothetical protein
MSDNLTITPRSSDFDVDRLRAWLDARPDAFEISADVYRIADSPAHADLLYRKSLDDRSSLGTFVHIAPREVVVENEGHAASQRSALDFIEWLASENEVRFGAGWGGERDVTAELRAHGVEHHYPEPVRCAQLAWPKQLREIGFFSDLSYGATTSISLEQARRDAPAADEDSLAAYLAAGRVYRAGNVLAIHDNGDVLGPADVLTDGVYLWPAQLADQVRRDHVRLPRHFLIHARTNGWRMPPVDLAALPGGEQIPPLTPDEVAWYTRPVVTATPEGDACSLSVAHGLATIGRRLRAGSYDVVHRGYTGRGTSVLVTFTMRHEDSYDELTEGLRLAQDGVEHPGIAPLLYIGPVESGSGRMADDVLVELEPPGRSILDCAPLPEAAAIACGVDVANILASFHERSIVLGGLAPEMIYVDDALRFTQLTPRSRCFVASVKLRSGGRPCYDLPYAGYEALVLGRDGGEAGDVFALCASLFHAVTGTHPFGEQLSEVYQRVVAKQPLPYPGSPPFGAILARGLDPDPNKRPEAAELAAALARLTADA